MDLPVDKFLDGIFSEEAFHTPSDSVKEEQIHLELPPWYEKNKFDGARDFFWKHSFMLINSMLIGLIGLLAIPSILKVLITSQRSSSKYTAYKRYLSTTLHTLSWFENELTPGSRSWKSLETVRRRHIRAGLSVKSKYNGTVSQRDMALTQFAFMGFSLLRPDYFGVRAMKDDDWDNYIHFWRTIGYMIGLQDRYNICRQTVDETREVCQAIVERVYTPCLENVPEYFVHMVKVLVEGMWSVNPTLDVSAKIYVTKYLARVPGYMLKEEERFEFQNTLKKALKNQDTAVGIESRKLVQEPAVDGLPATDSTILHIQDFSTLTKVPAYKQLTSYEKYKLNSDYAISLLYQTTLGRWYFNINFLWSVYLMKYCPYLAFFRFGVKASYVDIFTESPKDIDTEPKPNSYYNNRQPVPWYLAWIYFFWRKY